MHLCIYIFLRCGLRHQRFERGLELFAERREQPARASRVWWREEKNALQKLCAQQMRSEVEIDECSLREHRQVYGDIL